MKTNRFTENIGQRDDTRYVLDSQNISGTMNVYEISPGVEMIYQKFDCISEINSDLSNPNAGNTEIVELSYCKAGRFEYECLNGRYLYLGARDFNIELPGDEFRLIGFPLKYYEGISIYLYPEMMQHRLPSSMQAINFDFYSFKKKFCNQNHFVLRNNSRINEIFTAFYSIPEEIKRPYMKVKLQELLLLLHASEGKQEPSSEEYFVKSKVDKIKDIKELIVKNPKRRYTIDELAQKYKLSPTGLKNCFKGVYGVTMAEYMKQYRMQLTANLLKNTKRPVSDIAAEAGYENQSKFAAAFKEVMGVSPLEYRKTIV